MAVAATFPAPLTQDELTRWAEILPHIHTELARHLEARAARERKA